ncbi:MAG TPA: hypothetical protein VGS10_02315 [Terracidiphilus sp.]|nr:hypothetical protein [Terracidiphilus sp.]
MAAIGVRPFPEGIRARRKKMRISPASYCVPWLLKICSIGIAMLSLRIIVARPATWKG